MLSCEICCIFIKTKQVITNTFKQICAVQFCENYLSKWLNPQRFNIYYVKKSNTTAVLKVMHSSVGGFVSVLNIFYEIFMKTLKIFSKKPLTNWMTSEETLSNNNKYNQKLQHIYVMTKWMANNSVCHKIYIFGFHLLEAILKVRMC